MIIDPLMDLSSLTGSIQTRLCGSYAYPEQKILFLERKVSYGLRTKSQTDRKMSGPLTKIHVFVK